MASPRFMIRLFLICFVVVVVFRNSLKCIDPWLMAPTCIFLASKVEVKNKRGRAGQFG